MNNKDLLPLYRLPLLSLIISTLFRSISAEPEDQLVAPLCQGHAKAWEMPARCIPLSVSGTWRLQKAAKPKKSALVGQGMESWLLLHALAVLISVLRTLSGFHP